MFKKIFLKGSLLSKKDLAWGTMKLLDQLVRDKTGVEIMRYLQQNPMPDDDTFRKSGHSSAPLSVSDSTPEGFARFRKTSESHRWMYDQVTLKRLLEEFGSSDVRKCAAAESSIPAYNAFNLDTDVKGITYKLGFFYIEGIKN